MKSQNVLSSLTATFGGCVSRILVPRYCDYFKKRSPKTFGATTKRPLKFSNESKATSCPRTFDRTHKGSQHTLSDETKKPPKTFVTTKVRLRHSKREIVFRATPNYPNRLLKHNENHLIHFWRIWKHLVVGCPCIIIIIKQQQQPLAFMATFVLHSDNLYLHSISHLCIPHRPFRKLIFCWVNKNNNSNNNNNNNNNNTAFLKKEEN